MAYPTLQGLSNLLAQNTISSHSLIWLYVGYRAAQVSRIIVQGVYMLTHGYRQRSPHRRDGLATVYCPGYVADRSAFYRHGKSCRAEEHRKTLSRNYERKAWRQSVEYIPGLETP
jgi:hypothetical protein